MVGTQTDAGEDRRVRPSWLCRDGLDRERMLDMDARVRPVRRRAFAIIGLSIVLVGPWTGWWPLLFLLPAIAIFAVAERLMVRAGRPELVMFAAWIGGELVIAGAVALEGGTAGISAISWLAIPVITLSSRFSMAGVKAGVVVAAALVLAVGLGIDMHAVLHHPELVVAPLTLVLAVAVLSTPLMSSDIQHRSDAVIDPLTGMLNRKALAVRAHELALQAQITGETVGVIVADVDHFKRINDLHGHGVGDVVLREIAYLLRKRMRAFDLAYRLGGEEFLVLVPGAGVEGAAELAEHLRAGVAAQRLGPGLAVTLSFGVAASVPDQGFDYEAVFARADEALYRAKRSGRNQVCSHAPRPLALAL